MIIKIYTVSTENKSHNYRDMLDALSSMALIADATGYELDLMEVLDTLKEKHYYIYDTCSIKVVYFAEVDYEK